MFPTCASKTDVGNSRLRGGERGAAARRPFFRLALQTKVVVLSVETAEANNTVTIGVGPDRAPWRCLVKHGIVAYVMSLTDEGKL
jgi:hypothetical protein